MNKEAVMRAGFKGVIAGSMLVAVGTVYSDKEEFLLSFHGFEPDAYTEEGQAGLAQILSGKMFDFQVPMSAVNFRRSIAASKAGELGYDPTTDEGRFYSEGALPSFSGETDAALDMGLSAFEREGKEFASANCFACHSGVVNGVVVAGLASNSVIQTSSPLTEIYGEVVRGDNYGQYAVWNLAAHMANPEETGLLTSDEITPPVEVMNNLKRPPVQAMPWWTMKYKARDYWYGDGAPNDAAHFSLNFSIGNEDINEHHAEHVEMTARALAFARETQAPSFPENLDPELVQMGEKIFHGKLQPEDPSTFLACFQCHGEYTKKPSATDYSLPGSWLVNYSGSEQLRNVGTDSSYSEAIEELMPVIEHIGKLAVYYESQGTPELAPVFKPLKGIGYVPPPLVGVWATAPYFHNGSVPTIEAVLNSKMRPAIWNRDKSPFAYDLDSVGMEYTAMSEAQYADLAETAGQSPAESRARIDMTFIYNTSNYGRGNQGHTWGDSLNSKERSAVIEFLKSLSGADMPPVELQQQVMR